ncbi:phage tail protein, partial [Rahnella victoriana]
GRTQTLRMVITVSDTDAITLIIDDSIIVATEGYVNDLLAAHEKSRNHPDGTTAAKGFVQLSSSVTSDSETLAATPKAVKAANDNANGRLPLTGGTLSGGLAIQSGANKITVGIGTNDVYISNSAANKFLQLKHTGELKYDDKAVYHEGFKPTSEDVGALPANGTAVAATKLATARKIAGVAFDGTKDINLTPDNVGALPSGGTAVAATKLATARKIASVAFDGTSDITITYANVGALASDGTAVAAGKLATARKIAGVVFDGTADIKLTADNIDGLGSAAKVDTQASLNDYTEGRAALVGMGGIGSQSATRIDGGGIDAQTGALYSGISYSEGDGYGVLGTSGDIVTFTMNRGSRPCRIHMKYDEKRAWLSFYGGKTWSYGEIYTTLRKPSAADVGTYTQAEITDRVNARGAKNTASKSARGWWKCGDTGVIYQWGIESVDGATIKNFSFPVTFPTGCASLLVSNNIERTAGEMSMTGYLKSTSQFSLSNTAATGRSISWFAVGY